MKMAGYEKRVARAGLSQQGVCCALTAYMYFTNFHCGVIWFVCLSSGVHTCKVSSVAPRCPRRQVLVGFCTYEIVGYPGWEINFRGEGILWQKGLYETARDPAHHLSLGFA